MGKYMHKEWRCVMKKLTGIIAGLLFATASEDAVAANGASGAEYACNRNGRFMVSLL